MLPLLYRDSPSIPHANLFGIGADDAVSLFLLNEVRNPDYQATDGKRGGEKYGVKFKPYNSRAV